MEGTMGATEPSTTRFEAPRAGLGEWRARLRAAVYALYRHLEEDGGGRSARLVDAEVDSLSELIDEGRAQPSAPTSLTRITAEALAGAIFHELCLAATDEPFAEAQLVPELMYMAVLPYLGAARAAEELRIPPPAR